MRKEEINIDSDVEINLITKYHIYIYITFIAFNTYITFLLFYLNFWLLLCSFILHWDIAQCTRTHYCVANRQINEFFFQQRTVRIYWTKTSNLSKFSFIFKLCVRPSVVRLSILFLCPLCGVLYVFDGRKGYTERVYFGDWRVLEISHCGLKKPVSAQFKMFRIFATTYPSKIFNNFQLIYLRSWENDQPIIYTKDCIPKPSEPETNSVVVVL